MGMWSVSYPVYLIPGERILVFIAGWAVEPVWVFRKRSMFLVPVDNLATVLQTTSPKPGGGDQLRLNTDGHQCEYCHTSIQESVVQGSGKGAVMLN